MIHMHGMLSSDTNTSAAGQTLLPLSQSKLDSFHSALSEAVSSTLEKFGIHPNDVKISITRATEDSKTPGPANSIVRTAPPTPGTSSSSFAAGSAASSTTASDSTASSSAASGPPNGGYDPFLQAAYDNPSQNASVQSSTKSTAASSTASTTTTPAEAQEAFDNAYWAKQPAAVQPLRNMQNQEQRTTLATQLASEGYSIDVPIMVWGWDPSLVTSMREADGYTWVPSALQNPIEAAPGFSGYGTVAAYNPNDPPAGSIAV
jgi:hypothetical protein